MQDITIDVKPPVMAGALEYILLFVPVIGAVEVGAAGVENGEVLAIVIDYPDALGSSADIPAVHSPLFVSDKGWRADGDILHAGHCRELDRLFAPDRGQEIAYERGCHRRTDKRINL